MSRPLGLRSEARERKLLLKLWFSVGANYYRCSQLNLENSQIYEPEIALKILKANLTIYSSSFLIPQPCGP